MKNIILFGASKLGQIAYEMLNSSYNIKYFCDNNPDKWGKTFNNIEIIPPDELKNLTNIQIIITSQYYREIATQLQEIGIKNYRIFKAEVVSEDEINDQDALISFIQNFNFELKQNDFILHLVPDNIYIRTFISFINDNFNSSQHIFLVMVPDDQEIKYLSMCEDINVFIIKYSEKVKLFSYINCCSILMIHYLTDFICDFIIQHNIDKKIIWKLWGGDLYSFIDIELYDSETARIVNENPIKINKNSAQYINRRETIKKVSYILSGFKKDYNVIKENFITEAEHLTFFYPNPINFEVLDKVKTIYDCQIPNLNEKFKYTFLLGNSGFPTNNHIEILNILKKIGSDDFCVITPLSYGDPSYINLIINEGRRILGEQFIPLTDYLEPEDYAKILKKVDVAIMNHNRPQGVANIFALLYLGKKVYLKKTTTLFDSLVELGIKIYDIADIKRSSLDQIIKISKPFGMINKKIVSDHFSEKKAIENFSKVMSLF